MTGCGGAHLEKAYVQQKMSAANENDVTTMALYEVKKSFPLSMTV